MEFKFKYNCLFKLFVLAVIIATTHCTDAMATLSLPTRLQHLTINKLDGRVIVGASNYIYILDSDLSLQQNVSTGPHLDNIHCVIPAGSCSLNRVTENVNKILAIDYSQNKLVTCGSIFQGTCELRNLADISQNVEYRQDGDYYVAANDPEASTVAFIAPGPNSITNALYVGGTYTGTANTKYIRNNVPAVSTRKLTGDPFRLAAQHEFQFEIGSYMYTDSDARIPYKINYVTGFSYGGYSYFFTTQSDSYNNDNKVASNTITSKIVRVCHTDPNYYSYIEIPIECTSNGEKYNLLQAVTLTKPGQDLATSMSITPNQDILVAAFVKGQSIPGQPNNKPSNESAICVYSMEAIRDKITDNGNRCFLHSSSTNATYLLGGSKTCVAVTGGYGPSGSCGQGFGRFDSNSPIVGSIPMTGTCLWKSTNAQLTSILTTTVDRHTIAYVGTSTGHIKKIHVQSQTTAAEYADVLLDSNSAVQQDMLFESGKQAFYVMTQKKIQKMKVQECSSLTTCAECINAQDPHCGWCSLENKCSLKSECQNFDTPQRWLSDNVAHCPRFTKVTPDNISRGTTATLELSISLLTPGPTYTCVFGDSLVTPAETTAFGLRCLTPDPRLLPYTSNSDSTALLLSVNSSEAGVLFLAQNFTFFSCGYHTTRGCSSCVSSSWSCNWCLFDNTCTHNTAACQPGVITGTNVNLPGGRAQGAALCPQLLPPSTQILLPNGSPKVITLQAKNLPVPMNGHSGYVCKITVDLTQVTVPTTYRNSSMVICAAQAYTYEGLIINKKAKISLVWNDNFIVDNLHQVEATIYKCSVLGSECGVCLSLQDTYPEYQCGWCHKSCTYQGACQQSPFDACPPLQLSLVTPLNSPIDGGTRLAITGQDLGSSVQNVNNAVTVAGIPCTVIESEYEISKKIVCITGVTDVAKIGPVRVVIEGISSKWPQSFVYKNPQISTFEPFRGPMSGGTRITIKGTHLDTGTERTVQLDLMDCEIDRNSISPNATVCVTSSVDDPRTVQRLSMKFDKAIRQYYSSFYFTEDPTIKDITPLTAFLSGGRIVTVTGTNFQSIQQPLMVIRFGTLESIPTLCTVIDDTTMHCPTPKAPEPVAQNLTAHEYKRATQAQNESVISFIMDNVTSVQDLRRYYPNLTSSVSYVADPVYFEFTEEDMTYYLKDKYLILEGENLNLACTQKEVNVKIGNTLCNVTSLAETQLVCIAPKYQPEGLDSDGRRCRCALPMVTVAVGNLHFKVGYISYDATTPSGVTSVYRAVICVAFVLFIVLTIVYMWKKKIGPFKKKCHSHQEEYYPNDAVSAGDTENVVMQEYILTRNIEPAFDEETWQLLHDHHLVLKREQLDINEESIVGQGNHGSVYKGVLIQDEANIEVAVKMHKHYDRDVRNQELTKFLQEALIMRDYKHPNVLELIGICVDSKYDTKPLVVLPFMKHGDLLSFIRDINNDLNVKDLVQFAANVAGGMAYLSGLKFVHRDLAARNCLLGEDMIVKIADFGLSRDVYEKDYYSSGNKKAKLPVKWMALESLEKGVYTSKTDVWSYGIFLWELMTRGFCPYPEVDNWDIITYLKLGRRLPQPTFCPVALFDIMKKCWLIDSEERPTFTEIVHWLNCVVHASEKQKEKREITDTEKH